MYGFHYYCSTLDAELPVLQTFLCLAASTCKKEAGKPCATKKPGSLGSRAWPIDCYSVHAEILGLQCYALDILRSEKKVPLGAYSTRLCTNSFVQKSQFVSGWSIQAIERQWHSLPIPLLGVSPLFPSRYSLALFLSSSLSRTLESISKRDTSQCVLLRKGRYFSRTTCTASPMTSDRSARSGVAHEPQRRPPLNSSWME